MRSTFTTLRRLFDRDSDIKVNQLASVISITKTYYNISEDITRVLWFTVLINLNLAILNLMPIPVLDGGTCSSRPSSVTPTTPSRHRP